ncbi:uncharacterized protein Z520_11597 [Fonsecaea multimorphosa CBS 102226]|uniref:Uncharacterized protein n=1 Tax=Fonsecaea multimorphosa CBS 102226 TaxID=1442371 RepID=A0A0D2GTE6_9EURO|nr:uncharacterized protein Z520_11597 [Fonsecaea multimorphosa CBS 102226]KIX92745.1 hypothetical protein Z520_11597 [Fonsecaea multimorphosa CBS 102226]
MTVGRKGHRTEEFDDDNISDNSDGSSPPTVPSSSQFATHSGSNNAQQEANLPYRMSPQPCTLPSFETFIRDTFHQRSTSSPGSLVGGDVDDGTKEVHLPNSNRSLRTLSGSWLRDVGATSTYLEPVARDPPNQFGVLQTPSDRQGNPSTLSPKPLSIRPADPSQTRGDALRH